ncbi:MULTISPECIES: cobalt ECF transporter T component CbiQ [Paenibacillus]|uniref:cobalt ECF transporter T component CbiQ n=1 Tax=Paenibacillus TaxID=44249 RepID=UPI00088EDFB0|nr:MULTISPECIES: cobalt ECF transporter T component CbiQ [Paenibacillus]NTZ17998.1 cobalt ECF transporter T component CbiQ [Paenibacillus sp. JMULE4]SDJ88873.1 cobalt/nickel transport system permease protein [Paenibacillus naphthalenovorans]
MIKLIDTFSYTNRLRSVSPMWKSGFAAVLMVLSYLSHPVTQMMIVGWLFVWITLYARIPVKAYSLLIGASCLFYAASLPAIVIEFTSAGPVSPDGMILFTFARWTSYVTEAGIYEAGSLLARIIACLSCLAFVMLTTPMSELFQVMKKWRVPSLVLELMIIMYRFLFVLSDTAQQMYTAQRARGGQTGFYRRLNDTAVLIVRLFGKSMHRYQGLSQGLVTRGFADSIQMAPVQAAPLPFRYIWESRIGVILLLLIELWLRWGEML